MLTSELIPEKNSTPLKNLIDQNLNFDRDLIKDDVSSLIKTRNGYELRIELPGFEKEDIDISADVQSGKLNINANKNDNTLTYFDTPTDGSSNKLEYKNIFNKTYIIGKHFDAENIKAHMHAGVLWVYVPYNQSKKENKVNVEID
jgi:HSP20 family molecular chaperone IbpA